MTRTIVSLCLSIIFLVFLTVPTVIALTDDSIDISAFYASSEEEEKGVEKNKDLEIQDFQIQNSEISLGSAKTENDLSYFFKTYPKPHLNLISPPPELSIL